MLTTSTSQLTARARCSRSGSSAPSAALIRYQQSRNFRFGRIWTSLDPESHPREFHRDISRRQRKLRHKYAESLERRLSWEDHPGAANAKKELKWIIHDFCDKGSRSEGRRSERKTPDNPTGVRPGQNIEDAERGPMEHLLFGDKRSDNWFSPFQSMKGLLSKELEHITPNKNGRGSRVVEAEGEYVIDPITNRKVPKVATDAVYSSPDLGVETPASTTEPYKSQFAHFSPPPAAEAQGPILHDGPPPESELEKYGQVQVDSEPWDSTHEEHSSPTVVQPLLESEEYEKSHSTPSQEKVFWHHNDGIVPSEDTIRFDLGNKDSVQSAVLGTGDDKIHVHVGSGRALAKFLGLDQKPAAMHSHEDVEKHKPAAAEPNHQEVHEEPYQVRNIYTGEPNIVDAAELDRYKAFRYNEPDGKPPSATEDGQRYDSAEVQKYQAVRYNEPDGKPSSAKENDGYDPAEVRKYQAFRYNEPNGQPATEDLAASRAAEAAKYQPFAYNEPDGKPSSAVDMDTSHDAADEGEIDPSELRKYQPFGYNEPDGSNAEDVDATARSLEEFDREQRAGHRMPYIEPTEQERAEDLDLLRASDIRSAFEKTAAPKETVPRNVLETSMSRLATAFDAEVQEAAESLKEAKQRSSEEKQLTGNYVRDFPEDFARSWTSSVIPETTVGSTAAGSSPLQPALDRLEKRSVKPSAEGLPEGYQPDFLSKEPQGLQTSYEKEVGGKTQPIVATQYGDVAHMKAKPEDAITANSAPSTSPAPSVPTLYKVLAYDPSTQSINIADTTSMVTSTDAPMTPAEVLLRLSHPAKFVPHFGPLQAQGYEIASGNGDVLVFRKVRDATTSPSTTPSINPIDMTGSTPRTFPDPATGRFASPTGFVNYDFPPATKHRFVSNIDVRRAEPVFSGGKSRSEGGRGKKSLPKRMVVGAAWVAGVSYALGVVGEYFRTGGADGLGPRGL
jgi:hypothetical protein